VLLHPLGGPVIFVALMTALFAAVFFIAQPVSALIDLMNQALGARIESALGTGWLSSLLVDGVLGGAGTVLTFLPQIVILTVALELIDASGYLARGTFLVDRLLRIAGLGGRSFVPLLSAHACAVPAISAARIIRDPGQRLRTILVLPLMTCSARIPTYGLLITTFFAAKSVWFRGGLFVALYFAGLGFGLIASLVLGKTVKRTSQPRPLVLELPPYRVPQAAVVARVGWRAATRFVRDVGSVILIAAVVLWALLTVPGPTAGAPPPSASPRVVAMYGSLAAAAGRALEPVTAPAGFDWRLNVGLIGSFGARELMVGTLGVIFGIEDTGDDPGPLAERLREAKQADGRVAYGVATALSLMVFFVLACQCMSTLAAVRRETRSWRWPLFVFVYTYGAAWGLSVVVFQVASAAGL
jgi:ferrous iron transport protein B